MKNQSKDFLQRKSCKLIEINLDLKRTKCFQSYHIALDVVSAAIGFDCV